MGPIIRKSCQKKRWEDIDMLSELFTVTTTDVTAGGYFICTVTSLVLGVIIGVIHMYKNRSSQNFILTLAILPAVIQAVIMLVNGNIGTGVAVMGAFSLVRFRSVPGNSREISSIFLAMAAGLSTGTGYLGVAVLLVLVVGSATLALVRLQFGAPRVKWHNLKITIPENLEFEGIFDDIFDRYTKGRQLLLVKTSNMGSLYELQYRVELAPETSVKKFMDDIRCRNGNLTVTCGCGADNREEL